MIVIVLVLFAGILLYSLYNSNVLLSPASERGRAGFSTACNPLSDEGCVVSCKSDLECDFPCPAPVTTPGSESAACGVPKFVCRNNQCVDSGQIKNCNDGKVCNPGNGVCTIRGGRVGRGESCNDGRREVIFCGAGSCSVPGETWCAPWNECGDPGRRCNGGQFCDSGSAAQDKCNPSSGECEPTNVGPCQGGDRCFYQVGHLCYDGICVGGQCFDPFPSQCG